jgi:chromosome segregation ATPase
MAAWVTNALVRSHPDEVNLLLELGQELREVLADIDGDELRELTRQRYQLVSALVQQARSLASSQGKRVTDEVAQSVRTTLEATLSDQESADAVAAGRLTDALQVSGFSTAAPADGSPQFPKRRATPAAGAKEQESSVTDLEAERLRRARMQAERDVAAAAKAAQRAEVAASRAQQRLDSAERDKEEAAVAVDRLRSQLEEASAELDKRVQKVDEAREDSGEAQERVRRADAELEEARTRLEQLPA